MAKTVSDFFWERMHGWGVRRVYGYAGDGINHLIGALADFTDRIEFVQARHEELAALMASAHAKFTGEVGICLATSGPGAIHLLNGLYDARLDHQPVVAIVGQQARASLGGRYLQEVDLVSLFKDVADYVHMASSPAQLRHLIDRAMRIAIAERTVTCLVIPKDLQGQKAVELPPHAHGAVHSGLGYAAPRVLPADEDLRRAAEVLNAGERVAMLIGQGARGAAAEVAEVAERLGAGVAKALLGKDVLPDDLPWVTGSIGLLGTRPSYELMEGCDTLLMVGSGFPYSEWLPEVGKARGVQIDIDAGMLSLRYPMEVPLCGDARETLRALLPLIERKEDRGWREKIAQDLDDWWGTLEERAMQEAKPINPQRVFWELSPRLPGNAIITADSGSGTNWYARDIRIREGMMASLSGGLATMGPAMPYALAAKINHPGRPVVACVGDGAMQMNGINALITVADRWRAWADPRLVVLVLNNGDLNQVTWEMRAQDGVPKFAPSQVLPEFPFAEYARMLGLEGIRVDHPDGIAPAFERAFAADCPVLVEAMTDPEVPPLPPHITLKNAKALVSTVWSGDPASAHMLRQTIRDALAPILPGRG
jgi:pyruvate dehydrogenase (quinone)